MATNDPPWFPSAPAVMYGGAPIDLSPRYPTPAPAQPFFTPAVIQSPPPYAPRSELEIINALENLPADQRARVLRFATDKWPTEEMKRLMRKLAETQMELELALHPRVGPSGSGTAESSPKKPAKRRAKK